MPYPRGNVPHLFVNLGGLVHKEREKERMAQVRQSQPSKSWSDSIVVAVKVAVPPDKTLDANFDGCLRLEVHVLYKRVDISKRGRNVSGLHR